MFLYGASGHCKVIIEIIKSLGKKVDCVFDDDKTRNTILNIPVVQIEEKLHEVNKELIISIGNNSSRKKIAESLAANFVSVIHPSAFVSRYAKIGNGTVIMPNSVINADVVIGKHNIINSSAIIEHDSVLADYVHISPNASLAGNVTIGEGTHVGIGANVIQGIKIGKWVTVGAGSIIIEDIPDYAVVVGNPGRIIRFK